MDTNNNPKPIQGNTKMYLVALFIFVCCGVGLYFLFGSKNKVANVEKPYTEITTKNRGVYLVKNMMYTGASLDLANLEKVMKDIRSECPKSCKINLYSDRQAYELDIMAGESNFNGYSDQQKNYLSTHVLAFWGIDNGDSIEYYPSK